MCNASQWFGQSGVFETCLGLKSQEIFFDKALRDDNRFGVSAIEKEQIVAKILLVVLAIKAFGARSGVRDDDALADFPISNRGMYLGNNSREFVAEYRGRNNHLG